MSRNDHREPVVLMIVRFRMLVYVNKAGTIEYVAVAFGSRFQFAEKISELLDVPPADVAHDALPVGACRAGSFAISMRIVVMPGCRVAEPRKTRKPLALGKHVGSDPGLS